MFLKRLRNREDGQALVELAFVLPLVVLFLFGIIDFGLAINSYNGDTNLANLGARTVAVLGTSTSVECNGTSETS
ncbi:MAG TPA: TadE family protein, partial [Solirubrobacteraceae bacterium]|nr:TadE family protein [Solirubrobacteraceae bacterium]